MELNVIMKKLSLIQDELFVPKDQKNTFGNYNYRSCEDILKVAKPLASKNGCVIHLDTELIHEGEFNYIKATAYLTDIESGAFISAKGYAREEAVKKGMDGSQISGASTSYARKYALAGLFCIDNEKDSDATNEATKEEKKVEKKEEKVDRISSSQLKELWAELDRTGVSDSVIAEYVGKKIVNDLTQADFEKVMKKLNKTADKEKK